MWGGVPKSISRQAPFASLSLAGNTERRFIGTAGACRSPRGDQGSPYCRATHPFALARCKRGESGVSETRSPSLVGARRDVPGHLPGGRRRHDPQPGDPSIVEDLHRAPPQVLWIGDIYSFVLAGLLVTMGNLGDRYGRKRLLMIGSVAFGIISVGAAFAPSAEALILARALLGVAGATLMPSTLALMRSTFTDDKERTFAVGVWSAMGAASAAAGPLVGGILLGISGGARCSWSMSRSWLWCWR